MDSLGGMLTGGLLGNMVLGSFNLGNYGIEISLEPAGSGGSVYKKGPWPQRKKEHEPQPQYIVITIRHKEKIVQKKFLTNNNLVAVGINILEAIQQAGITIRALFVRNKPDIEPKVRIRND